MAKMLCPMVTRSRQLLPRSLASMSFLGNCCRNAVRPTRGRMALVQHANCRTFPTCDPTMVLPLLVGTSGDVAAGTHGQSPAVSQDITREAVSIAVETARREGV